MNAPSTGPVASEMLRRLNSSLSPSRIELVEKSDAARAVLGPELHAAVLAVRRYESSLYGGEDAHALTRFAWSS